MDDVYDMIEFPGGVDFTVLSNITFVGNKKGTILRYDEKTHGTMIFKFPNPKRETLTFKNFIFEGCSTKSEGYININSPLTKNFHCVFENCTFRNSHKKSIEAISDYHSSSHNDLTFFFNKCNF